MSVYFDNSSWYSVELGPFRMYYSDSFVTTQSVGNSLSYVYLFTILVALSRSFCNYCSGG
jgi:hypothetical protein